MAQASRKEAAELARFAGSNVMNKDLSANVVSVGVLVFVEVTNTHRDVSFVSTINPCSPRYLMHVILVPIFRMRRSIATSRILDTRWLHTLGEDSKILFGII
jgi:hypothetical protein